MPARPIVLTFGDAAGIGPEILVRAAAQQPEAWAGCVVAGDVAAMPADIRHRGYSPKRSMLIVWENNDNAVADLHQAGKIPPYPVEF